MCEVLIATGYSTSKERVSIARDNYKSERDFLNAIARELQVYSGQILNVKNYKK